MSSAVSSHKKFTQSSHKKFTQRSSHKKFMQRSSPKKSYPIDHSCLDFETTTPLFTRTSYCMVDDDICWVCKSDDDFYYFPCECPPEQRMQYYRLLVSIPFQPVKTTPSDSVYSIKVQTGIARSSEHLKECLSGTTNDLVCDFSISSTLDESDDPIRDLVREHVKLIGEHYTFSSFRGEKSTDSYISHFDTLVEKLKSVPITHVPKETPHMGRKKRMRK